jgi:cardiolipin synthase A/B
VTSLNWASAAADRDFPWADIGVHIHAPGIAAETMTKLRRLFPALAKDNEAINPAAVS